MPKPVAAIRRFLWTTRAEICKIIRLTCGRPKSDEIVFDGQIAFSPRLCDGLRGYMEDADDIGRVMITSEGIDFTGDKRTVLVALRGY